MNRLVSRARRAAAKFAEATDRAITQERLRLYPLAVLIVSTLTMGLAIGLGDAPHIAGGEIVLPDFLAHWTGGRMLLEGDTSVLYDPRSQLAVQSAEVGRGTLSWFVSPPFVGYMYAPFAALGYGGAALVWSVFSAACLVAAGRLVRPFAPQLFRDHAKVVYLVLAASEPVFEVLGAGQDSGLSVLLWVAGIRLLMSGRDVSGGFVLALGLFKPQLFFAVPLVLVAQRRWRALGAWAATALSLALVSFQAVGVDGVVDWIRLPFSSGYHEWLQTGQAWKMQSLPALASTLGAWSWIPTVIAVAAALVLFRQLWRARSNRVDDLPLWMLAIMATLVASPHLFIYDLVVALVPILWLVENVNTRTVRLTCVALFALTWTVPLRHLAGGPIDAAWSAIPLLVLWLVLARTIGVTRHSANPLAEIKP